MPRAKPSATLESHRRPHKRQRTCQYCGQSFSKTEHLDRHVRSHTREKPFACTICSKSYGRQDSLLRHVRSHGHAQNTTTSPNQATNGLQDVEQNDESATTAVVEDISNAIDALPTAIDSDISGWNGTRDFSYDSAVLPEALTTPNPADVEPLSLDVQEFESSWLLGEDFDLHALDSSIAATIFDWMRPPAYAPEDHQLTEFGGPPNLRESVSGLISLHLAPSAVSRVQQNWYTHVTSDATVSSRRRRQSLQEEVDDEYRASLTRRLEARMSDDTLPSADFLNLCIKLYFSKFHAILPIIHAPSFQPSSENALILLSICSVGALFVGSTSAAAQGRKIFQRLNKAILASWESIVKRGSVEMLSLAQAAIIGQTFAMSSGHPTDLYLAESFHGTVIAWARRGGMFQVRTTLNSPTELNPTNIERQWRTWIHAEETARIVIALHIHDAAFASTFHHEPLLRHDLSRLPYCCSEDAFSMPSADRWLALVINSHNFSHSRFRSYGTLAGILASIHEVREACSGLGDLSRFHEQLISWIGGQTEESLLQPNDPLCLLVLWHECFMSLYVNFDKVERWIGRDGLAAVQSADHCIRHWAASSEAKRCVLHALFIQKHLETLPAGCEPAIHVPRALFYSAIAIYTYLKANPSSEVFTPSQADLDLPELRLSQHGNSFTSNLRSTRTLKFWSVDYSLVCNATDLLNRLGRIEISRSFASSLEPLLDENIRPYSFRENPNAS